ncbi:hypothetical protein ACLMJK_002660 [Lecanora helva]
MRPPDPTNSDRSSDTEPANESIGAGESSGTPSSHSASAGGHGRTHHNHHPEPVNENLGRGFYISLAALALSFALYKFSRSSSSDPASAGDPNTQPLLTRAMQYYNYFQDRYAKINATHTAALERAGEDRNLFQSAPWTHHVELKFPEIFNTGSPYNVPAGHAADLTELKAHYERRNKEMEAKQMANLAKVAGESEILAQRRREEEGGGEKRPMSISAVLEWVGLKRPEE